MKPNFSSLMMGTESKPTSQDQDEGRGGHAEKEKRAAPGQNENGDGDGSWIKKSLASPDVSIYKVPASIRSIQEKAFEPQVVAFGPISRRKDKQPCPMEYYKQDESTLQLCPMDYYKLDAVKRTLKRVNDVREGDGEGKLEIGGLVDKVISFPPKIRNCYEDRAIGWDDKQLAWMLTMDACFILEFLRSCHENNVEFSLVFNKADNALVNDIRMDILKLENQIPLFILKSILELEGKNVAHFLATLLECCRLFTGFPFSEGLSCKEEIEGGYHVLDVCSKVITRYLTNGNRDQRSASHTGSRGQCISSPRPDGNCCGDTVEIALLAGRDTNQKSACDTVNSSQRKFSAEKLKKAGIKFKAGEGRVFFEDGTFSLHSITVDYKTEVVLRNLVAFEECQKCKGLENRTIISEYIMLMEDLIDSEADVASLKDKDVIIRNTGSDKEIVKMFDTLCKGITSSKENPFQRELVKVNEHYKDIHKLWKSEFKEKYCSKPWFIVSLLTAIVIAAVTIYQAVLNTVNSIKK